MGGGSSSQQQQTQQTTQTFQVGASDQATGQLLATLGGGKGSITAGSGGLAVGGNRNVVSLAMTDISPQAIQAALQGATSISEVIAGVAASGFDLSALGIQTGAETARAGMAQGAELARAGIAEGADVARVALDTASGAAAAGAEVASRALETTAEVAGAGLETGIRGLEIGADVARAGVEASARGLEIGGEVAGRALEATSGVAETGLALAGRLGAEAQHTAQTLGGAALETASGLASRGFESAERLAEIGAIQAGQLGTGAFDLARRLTETGAAVSLGATGQALEFGGRALDVASGAVASSGELARAVALGGQDVARSALEAFNVNTAAITRLADASQQRMAALVEARGEQQTRAAEPVERAESRTTLWLGLGALAVSALALSAKK